MALSVFLVGWAAVNLAAGGEGFGLLVSDKLHGEEEAISAVARLFAALTLWLFAAEESRQRLRWVAAGLVVLGLGNLAFGHLEPLIENDGRNFNHALYEVLLTSTLASAFFAVGLVIRAVPRLSLRAVMAVLAVAAIAYTLLFEILDIADVLPQLARVDSLDRAIAIGTPFGWLAPWHWVTFSLPLSLTFAATFGAFVQNRRGLVPDWLLAAMVLLAGSLLHEYLWPAIYGGEVLTTADALRLVFAGVVAVSGIFELRRIATERASLLATERERVRRLSELAILKADFSAMVAHELGGPLTSIRVCNDMLEVRGADSEVREYATSTIHGEIENLNALVSDVRAAADVERDDFSVQRRPLPLGVILADAESYAGILPGDHPVTTSVNGLEMSERVLADPQRIGQVLRNLLSNAARYTPEVTPIEIRASRHGGCVRIEVADRGPGIDSEDLIRIFEKFERGGREDRKVAGVGLGLYLSRRIMQGHGSDLTVDSKPGKGSVFAFDLEVER